MIKFILLGGQRTGSTFVNDCINSHPQVACLNELFTMDRVAEDCYATYMKLSTRRRVQHWLNRPAVVRSFLDETFAAQQHAAVGFKFMYAQTRWVPYRFPSVLSYARDNRFKIIHLVRKNYLRTLISREIAALTKVYHSTKKVEKVRTIRLEPSKVLQQLQQMRQEETDWRARLKSYDHITVQYENFAADKDAGGDAICAFLGVDRGVELRSRLVRLNPAGLPEVIKNFNEIEQILSPTEFAYLLTG